MVRFPLGLALLLVPLAAVQATTLRVYPDGSGDYPTILTAVYATEDGDIIELADGVYTGTGNRDISFLGKAITIRSYSGVPENCVIQCFDETGNGRRGFILTDGEEDSSILQGVTVARGRATDYPNPGQGGCVLVTFSSPRFVNCIFRDGFAEDTGGAIYCRNGHPTFINCRFENNESGMGGGLDCFFASPGIQGCEFVGNRSSLGGGLALRENPNESIVISASEFRENEADQGAGILADGGVVALSDCRFIENIAAGSAGVRAEGCDAFKAEGCQFLRNVSDMGPGALACHISWGGTVEISRSTFAENTGGIRGGGLLLATGGGSQVHADVLGCTFYGNAAVEGASIFCYGRVSASVRNSILSFGTMGEPVDGYSQGEAVLECSNVFGNSDGDYVGMLSYQEGVQGNISENPLFCDPENGDFTLSSQSPCLPGTPPNPECTLIGAWEEGCDVTPISRMSWGGIKSIYRHERVDR